MCLSGGARGRGRECEPEHYPERAREMTCSSVGRVQVHCGAPAYSTPGPVLPQDQVPSLFWALSA